MTKFAITASLAVFMLGIAVGRFTAPVPVHASAVRAEAISIDELTRKSGPLPVESYGAV